MAKPQKNDGKGDGDGNDSIVVFNKNVDLAGLPPHIQHALARFKTKERVGVAPTWKPTAEGECIVGSVTAAKVAGKYKSTVITLETPDGPRAVWLNADMKLKLGDSALVGLNLLIQFEGWLTKEQNPNIKKDMRLFRVIEVQE